MEKISEYIKSVYIKISKKLFESAFVNLEKILNMEEIKKNKQKEIIEILVLLAQDLIKKSGINSTDEKSKKIISKLYIIMEYHKMYLNPIFQDNFCYQKSEDLKKEIFRKFKEKKKKAKSITQNAPKFYMKGDKREFNQKIEKKKLKDRTRKIKKKLIKELQIETNLMLDKNRQKNDFYLNQNKKKMNRVMNELQQQKKAIERENTSSVRHHRIKKKGKRMAGNRRE